MKPSAAARSASPNRLLHGSLPCSLMRQSEHLYGSRDARRAAAHHRRVERQRLACGVEEHGRCGLCRRDLAAVVNGDLACARVEIGHERAAADARALRLDQRQHCLDRNCGVDRAAAAFEHIEPGLRRKRVGGNGKRLCGDRSADGRGWDCGAAAKAVTLTRREGSGELVNQAHGPPPSGSFGCRPRGVAAPFHCAKKRPPRGDMGQDGSATRTVRQSRLALPGARQGEGRQAVPVGQARGRMALDQLGGSGTAGGGARRVAQTDRAGAGRPRRAGQREPARMADRRSRNHGRRLRDGADLHDQHDARSCSCARQFGRARGDRLDPEAGEEPRSRRC